MTDPTLDVLVIGGGPAGATAAGLLARHGRQVVVAERERFPRPHVGESLQPASMRILDHHFGLGPALASAGFARKYGAVYVWGETREPWSVLFDDRLDGDLAGLTEDQLLAGPYEHAWQVDRAVFDKLLLDAARDQGAEVLEQTVVQDIVSEGDRVVQATLSGPDGVRTVRPSVVLDGSGQRCVLGRHFDLQESVPDLQSTATYGYFDGAGGHPGPLGRHVQLVVTIPEGWVWFIPVSATRTSVGVVHRRRKRLDRAAFIEAVLQAGLPVHAEGFCEDRGLCFARDWSFSHRRFTGENWMLLGDAACFVDPVLSGGVDFAIRGSANGALAILQAGDAPIRQAAAEHEKALQKEYKAYLELARYWYGNNRSVDGFYWQAHNAIDATAGTTPLRAFVYLTTGHYAADRHFRVFADWQERQMFSALGASKKSARAILHRRR